MGSGVLLGSALIFVVFLGSGGSGHSFVVSCLIFIVFRGSEGVLGSCSLFSWVCAHSCCFARFWGFWPRFCVNFYQNFHNDSKMAAACLQTAAMPPPLRPETDRSSYTNQPPTWQLHAFRQLPPGLRKPSKEHFLIFHRYSTELFRGWTFLLDFWKLLVTLGPCKIVNVSAFGTPSLPK